MPRKSTDTTRPYVVSVISAAPRLVNNNRLACVGINFFFKNKQCRSREVVATVFFDRPNDQITRPEIPIELFAVLLVDATVLLAVDQVRRLVNDPKHDSASLPGNAYPYY